MSLVREPIYSALFAQLSAIAGLVTTSRRLLHWSDCSPNMQPALFMTQGTQKSQTQQKGLPYKWDLLVKVWIYVNVPDGTSPDPVVNPILDQITALLTPANGNKLTLGGLVDEVIIDGDIETFEGTLGSQEVAIVPIRILVR